MTILPAAYLPSIEYCAHWAQERCVIDAHEHFVKRSERNRARILTANGLLDLTVQVVRANRPRTPLCDLRIDYSKRWQHQHWTALVSAYKASPYFDHYAARFEPFYTQRYEFLLDYNLQLMAILADALRLEVPPLSDRYLTAEAFDGTEPPALDLRPKKRQGTNFTPVPYIQVFADRIPFAANLSIVDLLFCEGPRSREILMQCRL